MTLAELHAHVAALTGAGDRDGAVGWLRDTLARQARRHDIVLACVNHLVRLGQAPAAAHGLGAALEAGLDHPGALRRAVQLLPAHGLADTARAALDRLAQVSPADAASLRAVQLLQDGQPDAALARAQEALTRAAALPAPVLAEARRTAIDAALALGDPRSARRHAADLAADTDPNALSLARLVQAESGPADAARLLHERTRDDAAGPGVWLALATCQDEAGAPGAARDTLLEARRRFPARPEPDTRLAALALRQNDPDTALPHARAAYERAPGAPWSLSLLAQALEAAGQAEKARDLLRAEAASPQAFVQLAGLTQRMGDMTGTAAALRAGLAAFPRHPLLMEQLSIRCTELLAARPELTDRLAPLLPPARRATLQAGPALARCDFALALAQLRRAFSGARDPDTAMQMGRVLFGLGRTALMRRYLRLCLRRWPGNQLVSRTLAETFFQRHLIAEALALLDPLRFADPATQARHHQDLCLLQAGLEDWDAARALYAETRPFLARIGFRPEGLLHGLIATGDGAGALGLLADLRQTGGPRMLHSQASLFGQLLTECEIAMLEENGPFRPLAGDDLEGHALCVGETPRSNISAMRMIRHWQGSGRGRDRDTAPGGSAPIPRHILQYWNSPTPPDAVLDMVASWRAAPGYSHDLLDRQTALQRLRAEFGPRWVQAFQMAQNPAEEADFLRLCLLARHGGVYADADDLLVGDLEALVGRNTGLVLYVELFGAVVANNFIAARPRHPVLVLAARIARQALLARSNESPWSKCGPGLMTRVVARYLARLVPGGDSPDLALLPMGRAVREIRMHNALGYKSTDSYWNASKTRQGNLQALLLEQLDSADSDDAPAASA